MKLLPKHGNCLLCQQLRERRFECSGKTFCKGLLDTGEVLVQIYQIYSRSHQIQGTDVCLQDHNWHCTNIPKLVQTYAPSRSLRSASERHLVVPSQRGTKSLSRTFSWTVPSWWNDLLISIRTAESLAIFKKHLKTHLFRQHLTN